MNNPQIKKEMSKTKVYYLLLAIVAVLMSGCKSSAEDLITDELREYVRNNFDDPNTFKEVVSIEPVDTLDNDRVVKLLRNSLEGAKDTNRLLDSLCNVSTSDAEFKKSITFLNHSSKYAAERYLEKLISVLVFNMEKNVELKSLDDKISHIIANTDSLPVYGRITYKIKYRAIEGEKTTLNEMFAIVDGTREKDNIKIGRTIRQIEEIPPHINDMLDLFRRHLELFKEKSEKYIDEHRSYKELKELL